MHASGFMRETLLTLEKKKEIIYSNCCKYGQIKIPPFKEPPEFLSRLINNKNEPISKHFLPKIRQYNSLFAFTSTGGNIDKEINKGEGPYVFCVNGQVHHRIGSLLPSPNKIPKFAELFIFDTENEIQNRIRALKRRTYLLLYLLFYSFRSLTSYLLRRFNTRCMNH